METRVRRRSHVTIADVGRHSGVSPTTVSHVLSGNRPVSEATRLRVEEAIRELGFRPSGVARSLRMQRSYTIALVIPDITNPFYPVLARGVQDTLAPAGYHVVVCNTDGHVEREREYVHDSVERRFGGIIGSFFEAAYADVAEALERRIPTVFLGRPFRHPLADYVRTDDLHASRAAVAHLIGRGHRRVGLVRGGGTGRDRERGYRRALADAGITPDPALVVEGDWSRAGGHAGMHRLLDLPQPPTAVFCANDLMAIGAMHACRERGFAIPEDVALVGYDDIEAAALVTPALTTIPNPAYEIGSTCARLLLERLVEGRTRPRRVVLPPSPLRERAST